MNLSHLAIRSIDSADWKKSSISEKEFTALLLKKIDAVSFKAIKEDIVKFIRDDKVLEIWSPAYFKELVRHIQYHA